MKIIKLEFENINSYKGRFSIDFTDAAFEKNYNQFVICGPTASGKTTILDVITIALYGRTPRQERLYKKGNEVMNKESAFCKASITYSCSRGIYESTFYQQRAHKHVNGVLQDPKYSIVNKDTDQEEAAPTTATDMGSTTERLIGLNYEQFVRSILIPQGDFSRFLISDARDKASILAKVSGTKHYKMVGARLWEKWNEVNVQYGKMKELRDDLHVLTDEEIGERKDELKKAQESADTAKEELNSLQKAIEWRGRLEAAGKSLRNAEQNKLEAGNKLNAFSKERDDLRKAEKAEKCREQFNIVQNLKKAQQDEKTARDNKAVKLSNKLKELEQATAKQGACEEVLSEAEKEEQKNRELWQKVRAIDVKIDAAKKPYEDKKEAKEKAVKNARDKKEKSENLKQSIMEQSSALEELQKYIGENEKDAGIEGLLATIRAKKENLHGLLNELAEDAGKLAEKEGQKTKAEAELSVQNEEHRKLSDRLHELIDQNLVVITDILHKKLEAGKPCPVCGARYHANGDYPQSGTDAQAVKVTSDVAALSEELEKTEKKRVAAQNCLEGLAKDMMILRQKQEKEAAEKETLIGSINACIVPWDFMLDPKTDDVEDRIRKIIEELKLRKDTFEKKKEAVAAGSLELAKKKAELEGIQPEQAEREAQEAERQYADAEAGYNMLVSGRRELFGDDSVDKKEKEFLDSLGQKKKALEEAVKAKNGLSEEKAILETSLQEAEIRIRETEPRIIQAEEAFREALSRNGFVSEEEYLTCIKTEQETAALQEKERALENAKTEAEALYESARKTLEETEKERCTDRSAEELTNLKNELEAKSDAARERIGEINTELLKNGESLERRNELDLELKSLLEQKTIYDSIREMIGKKDGADFEEYVQRIAMKNLLIKANEYMEKIQPDYRLVQRDDSMDILVQEDTVVRPISNTSGGETFCISLSLALAMAEFAGQNGSVEALFLDEGFGTLSGAPLMDAINALKRLGSTGKMLGIITHVEAVIREFDLRMEAKKVRKSSTLTGPGVSRIG